MAEADEPDLPRERELFLRGALLGNHEICGDVVDRLRGRGIPVDRIIQQVLTPALWRVGDLWEHGEIGVGQEHLATAVCERIVVYLFPPVVRGLNGTQRILMANAPGNRHFLGPKIVSHILESRKFQVDCLPGETPIPEILAFADLTRPRVVGVSLNMASQVAPTKELADQLRALLPKVRIMVGGFVVDRHDLAGRCGADAAPLTMDETFAVLDEWLVPPDPPLSNSVLPTLLR